MIDINDKDITKENVRKMCDLMATYLKNAIQEDGKFIYRINTDGTKLPDTYNILRHAGAIYVLSEYVKLVNKSEPVNIANKGDLVDWCFKIEKAIDWINKTCNAPIYNDIKGVFSNKKITGKKEPQQAKLGASALSLLAQIEAIPFTDNSISRIRDIANFLLFMQAKDGSFFSKFFPDKGATNDWESLYYPGEAILALARFHVLTNEKRYAEAATSGMKYLAMKRQGLREVPVDHWALIATHCLVENQMITRDYEQFMFTQHARQMAEAISCNFIFVLNQRRTTQISTRLEGLIAYRKLCNILSIKPQENLDALIHAGIYVILNSVITESKKPNHIGGITRDFKPLKQDERSNEIRIDYVQHALCAAMEFSLEYYGTF